jgi:hypothetical protein
VALDLDALPTAALDFLRERHLATLTTLRPDGSPHVVPVGFTYDAATRTARVITNGTAARRATCAAGHQRRCARSTGGAGDARGSGAGRARLRRGGRGCARVREALPQPRENPQRVVVEIVVERMLGLVTRPEA